MKTLSTQAILSDVFIAKPLALKRTRAQSISIWYALSIVRRNPCSVMADLVQTSLMLITSDRTEARVIIEMLISKLV